MATTPGLGRSEGGGPVLPSALLFLLADTQYTILTRGKTMETRGVWGRDAFSLFYTSLPPFSYNSFIVKMKLKTLLLLGCQLEEPLWKSVCRILKSCRWISCMSQLYNPWCAQRLDALLHRYLLN